MRRSRLWLALAFSIFNFQFSISAQTAPPGHDISKVDPAPLGGSIATPIPEEEQRRMRRYEIPELVGARQALGSQLIDGRLPKPLLDLVVDDGKVGQRISFFEGGLVVVRMGGVGGTIRKRVLLPPDAVEKYLSAAAPAKLRAVDPLTLRAPTPTRKAVLRVYEPDGTFVERSFDPANTLPKPMYQQVMPLQDLLRAISIDRTVTSTIAGYEPQIGDELVGDDRKTWRVERILERGDRTVVELRCLGQPQTVYIAKQDLHQYFVGARAN